MRRADGFAAAGAYQAVAAGALGAAYLEATYAGEAETTDDLLGRDVTFQYHVAVLRTRDGAVVSSAESAPITRYVRDCP